MNSEIELLPYPNDSILVDSYFEDEIDNLDLILDALNVYLEESDLKNLIKIKKRTFENDELIIFNSFFTQIVFCSFFQDEVIVSMHRWFQKNKAPQLILATQIDEENHIVRIVGALSGDEFKKILFEKDIINSEIKVPLNKFEGGIDLFLSYLQFLNPNTISRKGFLEELQKGEIKKSKDFYIKIFDDRTSEVKDKKASSLNEDLEKNIISTKLKPKKSARLASDSIGYYLSSIGRVPL